MDAHFYDTRTAARERTRDNPEMRALLRRIGRWCELGPEDRVLDLGCFDGFILRKLHASHGISGVGLDISPRAVTLAKALTTTSALTFQVSDGSRIDQPDASFDAVICSEILEHVEDLDGVLSEVARVLRPGGRMYATMPNALGNVLAPLRPLCRRVDALEGHVRRMGEEAFTAALARHRLAVRRSRHSGFIAAGAWYSAVVYNPRIKDRALSLVESRSGALSRLASWVAGAAVHSYLLADAPFAGSRSCMGVLIAAERV